MEEDWFLLPFELELQRAHATALLEAGIFNDDERDAIGAALEQIKAESSQGLPPVSDTEDLHTWVEAQLVQHAGDVGKKIHTARSRNDQVATLLKMYAIDTGGRIAEGCSQLCQQLATKAIAWAELIFPLQTHCQFAAPGSVGFWALRYAVACERAGRQLDGAVAFWREDCPLGSGAVAGSSIPLDRNTQAILLGFDDPSENALDSTSTRDACLELLANIAHLALHLQSFATDVIAFSQTQFGWTKYPQAFGTGSSMMPNKTNPDAMELLRGECNSIVAAHNHAMLLMKGLPSGYNRDLQCIKPIVHDACRKLIDLLEMTTCFVDALAFDSEKMQASLGYGHIEATLRMEQKVQSGMALRDAHHAVADDLASGIKGTDVAKLADTYQTIGSASPAETVRVAKRILARLTSNGDAKKSLTWAADES
ncbi:MAG: argininosuccinate lyase [Planctomycetes bacterium]|nr:argininosuccinate lyase [Planctomycetota bacterium]